MRTGSRRRPDLLAVRALKKFVSAFAFSIPLTDREPDFDFTSPAWPEIASEKDKQRANAEVALNPPVVTFLMRRHHVEANKFVSSVLVGFENVGVLVVLA